MSFFGTETYSSQSGGLATFSHCQPHQKQTVPQGGAVLHPTPRQQQQQQLQPTTTQATQQTPSLQQQQQTQTQQPPQQQQQQTPIVGIQPQQQQQQQQQQPTISATQHFHEILQPPLPTSPTSPPESETQAQQPQQQQQQQQPAVVALFGNGILSSINGYDVLDNKTNESIPIYIQKHQRYIMNDIFHREDERLKTFDTWPLAWLDKQALAQTGMFYTGEDDKVKCYFCEVEIGRWEHDDHPVSEHLRWFPNCPLLRRRTTNNVPIDAEALDHILPPVSYDICGANDSMESTIRTIHASVQLTDATTQFISLTTTTTTTTTTINGNTNSTCTNTNTNPNMPTNCTNSTNISAQATTTPTAATRNTATATTTATTTGTSGVQTYYPEYPEYAIESARLRSFAEWPRHMKQKPEQLAEAGFFYIGTGDRVKCFSCGGGLKDWADDDEPWEQHTLWMSKCRFLKLMKGQNYIDSILNKKQKDKQDDNIPPLSHDNNTNNLNNLPKGGNGTLLQAELASILAANNKLSSLPPGTSVTACITVGAAAPTSPANLTTTTTRRTNNNNNSTSGSSDTNASDLVAEITVTETVTTNNKQQDSTTNTSTSTPIEHIQLGVVNSDYNKTVNATPSQPPPTMTSIGCIPEEKLCKICYADEYNTAFLPCGHVVACAKCASSVTKCPLCRKPFTDVMRVYFS